MLPACQMQVESNTARVFCHRLDDMPPQHAGLAEDRGVAKDVESTPSSGQSHADAVFDIQKPNVTTSIASDKRE